MGAALSSSEVLALSTDRPQLSEAPYFSTCWLSGAFLRQRLHSVGRISVVSDSENGLVGTTFWHSPAYKLNPLNSSGPYCEANNKTRGQHAWKQQMRSGSGFTAGVPHQTAPGFCLFPPPPPEPHGWERLASTGKDGWKDWN